jgi:hypothetical protein
VATNSALGALLVECACKNANAEGSNAHSVGVLVPDEDVEEDARNFAQHPNQGERGRRNLKEVLTVTVLNRKKKLTIASVKALHLFAEIEPGVGDPHTHDTGQKQSTNLAEQTVKEIAVTA